MFFETLLCGEETHHMPNFLISQKYDKDLKKIKIKRRDFSKFNKEDFISEITETNIHNKVNKIDNTNDKFNMFNDIILTIFNKHAPYKQLSNKETKNLVKPWIAKGILNSIKIKHRYYSKYMKCLDPFWYSKYKKYRDKINHLIRISKYSH